MRVFRRQGRSRPRGRLSRCGWWTVVAKGLPMGRCRNRIDGCARNCAEPHAIARASAEDPWIFILTSAHSRSLGSGGRGRCHPANTSGIKGKSASSADRIRRCVTSYAVPCAHGQLVHISVGRPLHEQREGTTSRTSRVASRRWLRGFDVWPCRFVEQDRLARTAAW